MSDEKMIPLSVVDAFIKEYEEYEHCNYSERMVLEEIKKEAIVPVQDYEQRIRDMVPKLEYIMDLIEPFDHPEFLYEHKEKLRDWYIKLKEINKEAIEGNKPLKQQIKDRIKELEKQLTEEMDNGRYQTEKTGLLIVKIDELRKLLE